MRKVVHTGALEILDVDLTLRAAVASETMDRIGKTGVIRIGFGADVVPF